MTIEEKALCYLEKDALAHIDMIEVIRRGFSHIYYADEDGVAMAETKGGTQYMSAADQETAEKLLALLKKKTSVIVHQEFAAELAREKLELSGFHPCYTFAYPKKEKVYQKAEDVEIRRLSMEWRDRILENYRLVDRPEYIELLIEDGVMHGAFADGELAGFIGIHTEGCMGLLEVLPAYRRRGIGELLERYMIDWNLERGFVPFCQVFKDNEASLRLQEKLGMVAAASGIWWVYR